MSGENVQIVRSWWAAFNDDGLPPLELCDPAIEIRIADEFPFTGIYHGHEGVRRWAADLFDVIEDHHTAIEGVREIPDDETIVATLRSTGRSKEMQFEMELPWAAVIVIRDGKVSYARGYLTFGRSPRSRRAVGVGHRTGGQLLGNTPSTTSRNSPSAPQA
jgi:ketosteroid isomerase-like protein